MGDALDNSIRFPHLLKTPALFSGLSDAFANHFLNRCTVKTFAEGEVILRQGHNVTDMFLVAFGLVEVTSSSPDGRDVLIAVERQAQIFGEIEALADKPAAASCRAAKASVLLLASRALLQEAANEPTFLRNLFRSSYDRLKRDNEAKFVDQYYPLDQRLCYYLHQLSADRPEISRTQTQLSELLGCARQTINKELGRLRAQGILDRKKGMIVVLNRDALRSLAAKAPEPA